MPPTRGSAISKSTTRHTPRKTQTAQRTQESDHISISSGTPPSSQYYTPTDPDSDSEPAATPAPSHHQDGLAGLMDRMVEEQRKRRSAHESLIQTSYTAEVNSTKQAMDKLFDEHEAQSAKAHEAQVARLKSLFREKARLEAAMQDRVEQMRRDYLAAAREVQAVAEYRAQQLGK
ncbi:hypothetical protein EJ04DRAFT_482666 [Polyplosphaeria fusca]|uniref:Uncharacterized protein n=1 Tax=Polyplosphaeria fusca TaxID=682080 RepID=A0A9P4RBL8_9PLEO|nr:hypothetical protein EJ04DRAFT_482666 [Polyplosphaeria fusca]